MPYINIHIFNSNLPVDVTWVMYDVTQYSHKFRIPYLTEVYSIHTNKSGRYVWITKRYFLPNQYRK